MSLADFRGKVVLLNIWATWCAPCRREMPTLDRLQAQLGGSDFEVVALSIDRKGLPVVKEFYAEIGLDTLPIYVDQSGSAQRTLSVLGVPTTLLLDREGNEIGRLLGPAEWDSPEMMAFFRDYLKRTAAAEARGWSRPAWVDRGSWSHARHASLPATETTCFVIRRLGDELIGDARRDQTIAGAGLAQCPALLGARSEWRDRVDRARGRDRRRAQLELAGRGRDRAPVDGRAAVRGDVRLGAMHEQNGRPVVLDRSPLGRDAEAGHPGDDVSRQGRARPDPVRQVDAAG
jgi:thiol-disulfide isomerase/thioredoxin